MNARKVSFHLSFFNDPSALLQAMDNGSIFHLLFLDIYYDSEKGIQFARLLRERNDKTDIIFMTALSSYAAESYDAAPLHYLIKPIQPDKLDTALARFLKKNVPQNLHLITARGHFRTPIRDVLYFEIYGHNIVIHLADGGKESCIGTLKELEGLLPKHTFVRPHRSYLINLEHITKIMRYQIQLSSGDLVPVSKNLYHSVLNDFIQYANESSISL